MGRGSGRPPSQVALAHSASASGRDCCARCEMRSNCCETSLASAGRSSGTRESIFRTSASQPSGRRAPGADSVNGLTMPLRCDSRTCSGVRPVWGKSPEIMR
jgi:hypothetical protein